MQNIPLGLSDWQRKTADEPDIPVLNRYFENNPTNLGDQVGLIARPGLRKILPAGSGPNRGLYSQPGSFNDALFCVSGEELYRVNTDLTVENIGTIGIGGGLETSVSMAATARIGSVPEYLYFADGQTLLCYTEDSQATATLTAAAGGVLNGDVIQIGTVYYQWTTSSVDAGSPDGTSANPWLVARGPTTVNALDNMRQAINALTGTPGETYSSAIIPHPTVQARSSSLVDLVVQARENGTAGNAINVAETTTNCTWSGATLEGGGDPTLFPVSVPDDLGVISVGFIAGYIICVVAQGQSVNGRFYWINPAETWIEPQNFATAERSPDPLYSVRVIGDRFWLLGSNSAEVWYPSGAIPPFARAQGIAFARGIWEGTDVAMDDEIVFADQQGTVFIGTGNGFEPISNPGIEERIRLAIRKQKGGI